MEVWKRDAARYRVFANVSFKSVRSNIEYRSDVVTSKEEVLTKSNEI